MHLDILVAMTLWYMRAGIRESKKTIRMVGDFFFDWIRDLILVPTCDFYLIINEKDPIGSHGNSLWETFELYCFS